MNLVAQRGGVDNVVSVDLDGNRALIDAATRVRGTERGQSPVHRYCPIAQTCPSVRMNSSPSEIAGDAMITSPIV